MAYEKLDPYSIFGGSENTDSLMSGAADPNLDPSNPMSSLVTGQTGTPNPGLPAPKAFNPGAIANSPVDVSSMMAAGPSGAGEAGMAGPAPVAEPAQPFNAAAISNVNPPAAQPQGPPPGTQITPSQASISPYDDTPGPGGMINQAGDLASTAGDAALMFAPATGPAAPFVAGAGLAVKAAGTVAGIYGKYQDRQEAKKKYEERLRQWEKSEKERKDDKIREQQRAARQEGYYAADYAKDTTDYFANSYTGERTPGGQ